MDKGKICFYCGLRTCDQIDGHSYCMRTGETCDFTRTNCSNFEDLVSEFMQKSEVT